MERYDARFWRNSTMTSLAASKSWNFCGRRGVNSSIALRTAAGSNEDIGLDAVDANRETDRWRYGHCDAAARTGLCRGEFADDAGQWRRYGHGKFGIVVCLRNRHVRCCGRVVGS